MNLNLIAPINSLGYGQVGKNVCLALSELADVALFPMGQPEHLMCKGENYKIGQCTYRAKMPDWNAPCIRLWHQHDMSQFVGDGPKIGFPIFELDKFTDQEKHHLSNLDKVFVCSNWAKNIIIKEVGHLESSVHVVPLGVKDYGQTYQSVPGPTRFFTCGKWEVRKGHDALIKAFNLAFEDEDDVELHMMCHNPFLSSKEHKDWENKYINSNLGHKVRLLPRVQTHEEVLKVMDSMDCGVFISRAEGWNLELLEMMSRGKQVIATNYSAHTEFCNSANSKLVHIDEKEDAYDGIWFHNQGRWGKLGGEQIKQTAGYMKDIHEKKKRGDTLVNVEGMETEREFTWKNTAQEIINGTDSFTNF